MTDRRGHNLVVGRMKFDLIKPMSEAIVGPQHRLVGIGQKAQFHQAAARQFPIGHCPLVPPAATQCIHPVA